MKEEVLRSITEHQKFFAVLLHNFFEKRMRNAEAICEEDLIIFQEKFFEPLFNRMSEVERHYFYRALQALRAGSVVELDAFFTLLPKTLEFFHDLFQSAYTVDKIRWWERLRFCDSVYQFQAQEISPINSQPLLVRAARDGDIEVIKEFLLERQVLNEAKENAGRLMQRILHRYGATDAQQAMVRLQATLSGLKDEQVQERIVIQHRLVQCRQVSEELSAYQEILRCPWEECVVGWQDSMGRTVFHYAGEAGQLEILDCLIGCFPGQALVLDKKEQTYKDLLFDRYESLVLETMKRGNTQEILAIYQKYKNALSVAQLMKVMMRAMTHLFERGVIAHEVNEGNSIQALLTYYRLCLPFVNSRQGLELQSLCYARVVGVITGYARQGCCGPQALFDKWERIKTILSADKEDAYYSACTLLIKQYIGVMLEQGVVEKELATIEDYEVLLQYCKNIDVFVASAAERSSFRGCCAARAKELIRMYRALGNSLKELLPVIDVLECEFKSEAGFAAWASHQRTQLVAHYHLLLAEIGMYKAPRAEVAAAAATTAEHETELPTPRNRNS